MASPDVIIIGAGLAGSEAAWQIAQRGFLVHLYEMRPLVTTGAHQTSDLAELVCSNSLGSILPDRASGVLKSELRTLGSLLMEAADFAAIPAGTALAVDRSAFSEFVERKLAVQKNIEIIRQEMTEIPPNPTIIATGPLTSKSLSDAIARLTGERHLFFYDAIAPIVTAESIDLKIAFRASRYGKGNIEDGDYLNCPLSKDEYDTFILELLSAKRIPLRTFEEDIEHGVTAGAHRFFEGCLPVEIIAQRGEKSLTFGPMRPTGLTDPRTGRWPYAVVQLRQDNLAGSNYNLVGFQTNLTFPEQKRVFRMIPGLEEADFTRYGQMHRNTFIASPKVLLPTLQYRNRPDISFAGQITGVEGYLGNIGTGLLAGINMARFLKGIQPFSLPPTSILGALCHYITHADLKDFQPMKANFGILPPLANHVRAGKRERARLYAERSARELRRYIMENSWIP